MIDFSPDFVEPAASLDDTYRRMIAAAVANKAGAETYARAVGAARAAIDRLAQAAEAIAPHLGLATLARIAKAGRVVAEIASTAPKRAEGRAASGEVAAAAVGLDPEVAARIASINERINGMRLPAIDPEVAASIAEISRHIAGVGASARHADPSDASAIGAARRPPGLATIACLEALARRIEGQIAKSK